MQFPLQLLDPPVVLPSFHSASRPRLTEAGDRIPLPGIQFRRIQPLLAAPGTASRFVHRSCDNHRFQPCCRRPALVASNRAVGQGGGPPTLQRRHADPDLTGDTLHR